MNAAEIVLGMATVDNAKMMKSDEPKGVCSIPWIALFSPGINKGIRKICEANDLQIKGTDDGITIMC